jgi:hypothetical protein
MGDAGSGQDPKQGRAKVSPHAGQGSRSIAATRTSPVQVGPSGDDRRGEASREKYAKAVPDPRQENGPPDPRQRRTPSSAEKLPANPVLTQGVGVGVRKVNRTVEELLGAVPREGRFFCRASLRTESSCVAERVRRRVDRSQ